MRSPEQIEEALSSRLLPRGCREESRQAVHAMLDELAAEGDGPLPARGRRGLLRAVAALALLGVAVGVAVRVGRPEGETSAPAVAAAPGSEVELVSESVGVIAAEQDRDWHTDADGNFFEAWHLQVVNEERFHDPQSGHDVRVLQPRAELVLVPVSTF